jgi:predicted amidohydrolase
MKINIVQTRPQKGNIAVNLANHLKEIEKAVNHNADFIVFPELSLTGYEPQLARKLAIDVSDERLIPLQELSNKAKITICVGCPTLNSEDLLISMLIFRPNQEVVIYSKQYLYPTEKDIFIAGSNPFIINFDDKNIIAPAICYELSNKEHHENAKKHNANIYIASVLNSVNGIDADIEKLSTLAKDYKMTVFMANYVGTSGGYECAGFSSIWDKTGQIIAQLDNFRTGQIIYDTEEPTIISYLY